MVFLFEIHLFWGFKKKLQSCSVSFLLSLNLNACPLSHSLYLLHITTAHSLSPSLSEFQSQHIYSHPHTLTLSLCFAARTLPSVFVSQFIIFRRTPISICLFVSVILSVSHCLIYVFFVHFISFHFIFPLFSFLRLVPWYFVVSLSLRSGCCSIVTRRPPPPDRLPIFEFSPVCFFRFD